MKKLWPIPVITAYIYGITILAIHGYNSYFNIPYSLMDISIVSNTVYLNMLVMTILSMIKSMSFLGWSIWIVIITVLAFSYHKVRYLFIGLFTLFLIIFLFKSVTLGEQIAKNSTNFFIPSQNCKSIDNTQKYIIPAFYNGEAILIPIDNERKMVNGFLLKDISDLNCKIEMGYNIGPITK